MNMNNPLIEEAIYVNYDDSDDDINDDDMMIVIIMMKIRMLRYMKNLVLI